MIQKTQRPSIERPRYVTKPPIAVNTNKPINKPVNKNIIDILKKTTNLKLKLKPQN